MAIDAQKAKARTVTVVPPSPWTTASASLQKPDGTALSPAPVTTPRSASNRSVASATDGATFVVDIATGISRGVTVRVTDATQWGEADAVVANVSGTAVTLVEPLPATPAPGATVRVLDVDVALTSTHTADLGLSFLLEVSSGEETVREVVNVVAFPYVGPMTARRVRDYVATQWPAELRVRPEAWYARVADEANRYIRGRLLEGHVYVSQYWDPDALLEIGWLVLQRELFKRGLRMPGQAPDVFMRSVNFELRDRLGGLLKSATPNDTDRDGIIDSDEVEGIESTLLER